MTNSETFESHEEAFMAALIAQSSPPRPARFDPVATLVLAACTGFWVVVILSLLATLS
ncbi:MAG: hypothetical protein KDK70_23020 [Myxococcales bacterium]|nr:hypothetical protein [Myxococcales bacterium]